MNVLVCYRINQHSTKMAGVFNKLLGQLHGLSQAGAQTFGLFMSLNRQVLVKVENGQLQELNAWQPVSIDGEQRTFWHNARQAVELVQANVLYCRYDQMYDLPVMADFYRFAQTRQLHCILELPTFPYAQEIQDAQKRQTDETNRLALAKHTDIIFSTATDKTIMGIENVFFTNQVNQNVFEMASDSDQSLVDDTGGLVMLSVANVREWHGFDRAIKGLANYYLDDPKIPIHYHIIGEGNSLPELKALATSLEITQRVSFHGHKTARQMLPYYRQASAGIASLGLHRIGIQHSSTLKVREYLANGLPVVACNPDPAIDDLPWVDWCTEDDSPIDFAQIAEFICRQNENPNVRQNIRNYAKTNLSWRAHAEAIINHCATLSK